MGKGKSGKKSPAVMIFFFSRPHVGTREMKKKLMMMKQMAQILNLFIPDSLEFPKSETGLKGRIGV
jgi:hypothetical protein